MSELIEIKKHLNKCKVLKGIIKMVPDFELKKSENLYESLISAIVSQQLSVKAANTILGRFLALYKNKYPKPAILLATDNEVLRSVGLSYQKAGYLKNIAQFSIDKSLDYKKLQSKTDEDLIEYLTEIKGVGRWTVEMILMFSLKRTDILPEDDLGIQQAMIKAFEIESENKKELKVSMQKHSAKWSPYRTYASMYLWRWKDAK